ncbi:mitochondrial outer membrane protein porin of 36 kDa [Phtheirospermum japonicum]|uniref:Mitochondrial outer membrane protein porin of 36 kDa n=1 Tax=Phtheirospermum japonicum TaxID=374723 RepID=A0A830BSK3_9LAMI|nr:mitochondrial outer membrane protein porin of 36 kDa [Phtheirospermum japonicum]
MDVLCVLMVDKFSESLARADSGETATVLKMSGQRNTDILYKDHVRDQLFSLTHFPAHGTALTFMGMWTEADSYMAKAKTQLKPNDVVTADFTVDTRNNISSLDGLFRVLDEALCNALLSATLAITKSDPGLKTSIAYNTRDKMPAKVELEYSRSVFCGNLSFPVAKHPNLNISAVLGSNKLALGCDLSYDFQGLALTSCKIAGNFVKDNLNASCEVDGKAETVGVSCTSKFNPTTSDTAFAVQVTHRWSSHTNTVAVGTVYNWSESTTLKCRLDNVGHASVAFLRKMGPARITLSSEIDTRPLSEIPKVGLSVALVGEKCEFI